MVGLTYIINFGIFLAVLGNFIEKQRCFVREAGRRYDAHVGLEFSHTFMEKVSCYSYWAFASWLVIFVLIAVGLVMYLRSLDSSPVKITTTFIALEAVLVFLTSFVIAGEGHSRLVGG